MGWPWECGLGLGLGTVALALALALTVLGLGLGLEWSGLVNITAAFRGQSLVSPSQNFEGTCPSVPNGLMHMFGIRGI